MAKYRGSGTTLELGSTNVPGTGTFTLIPQIKNLKLDEQAGEIDATDLASARKEYVQALADSAKLTGSLQYDPALATHNEVTGLVSLFNSGATRNIRLRPPGATQYENYVCFVMDASRAFDPEQIVSLDFTLRATGAATYTPIV